MTEEQIEQIQEEEIQVSVVEEPTAEVASEEELDQYTKKVSKRIKNFQKIIDN